MQGPISPLHNSACLWPHNFGSQPQGVHFRLCPVLRPFSTLQHACPHLCFASALGLMSFSRLYSRHILVIIHHSRQSPLHLQNVCLCLCSFGSKTIPVDYTSSVSGGWLQDQLKYMKVLRKTVHKWLGTTRVFSGVWQCF